MAASSGSGNDNYREFLSSVRSQLDASREELEQRLVEIDPGDFPALDVGGRGGGPPAEVLGQLRALHAEVAQLRALVDAHDSVAAGAVPTFVTVDDHRLDEVVSGLAVTTAQLADLRTTMNGLSQSVHAVTDHVVGATAQLAEELTALRDWTSKSLVSQGTEVRSALEQAVEGFAPDEEMVDQLAELQQAMSAHSAGLAEQLASTAELGAALQAALRADAEVLGEQQHALFSQLAAGLRGDVLAAVQNEVQVGTTAVNEAARTILEHTQLHGQALVALRTELTELSQASTAGLAEQTRLATGSLAEQLARSLERDSVIRRTELAQVSELVQAIKAAQDEREAAAAAAEEERRAEAAIAVDAAAARHEALVTTLREALAEWSAIESQTREAQVTAGRTADAAALSGQLEQWSQALVASLGAAVAEGVRPTAQIVSESLTRLEASDATVVARLEESGGAVAHAIALASESFAELIDRAAAQLLVQQSALAGTVRTSLDEAAAARQADTEELAAAHTAQVDALRAVVADAGGALRGALVEVVRSELTVALQEEAEARRTALGAVGGVQAEVSAMRADLAEVRDATVSSLDEVVAETRRRAEAARSEEAHTEQVLAGLRDELVGAVARMGSGLNETLVEAFDHTGDDQELVALRAEVARSTSRIEQILATTTQAREMEAAELRSHLDTVRGHLEAVRGELAAGTDDSVRDELVLGLQAVVQGAVQEASRADAAARQEEASRLERSVAEALAGLETHLVGTAEALGAADRTWGTRLEELRRDVGASLAELQGEIERAVVSTSDRDAGAAEQRVAVLRSDLEQATTRLETLVSAATANAAAAVDASTRALDDELASLRADLTAGVAAALRTEVGQATGRLEQLVAMATDARGSDAADLRESVNAAVAALEDHVARAATTLAETSRSSGEQVAGIKGDLRAVLADIQTDIEQALSGVVERDTRAADDQVQTLRAELAGTAARLEEVVAAATRAFDAGTRAREDKVDQLRAEVSTGIGDQVRAIRTELQAAVERLTPEGRSEGVDEIRSELSQGLQDQLAAIRSEVRAAVALVDLGDRGEDFDRLRSELRAEVQSAVRSAVEGAGSSEWSERVEDLRSDLTTALSALHSRIDRSLEVTLDRTGSAQDEQAALRAELSAATQRLEELVGSATRTFEGRARGRDDELEELRSELTDAVAELQSRLIETAKGLGDGAARAEQRVERLRGEVAAAIRGLATTEGAAREGEIAQLEQALLALRADVVQATSHLERLVLETSTNEVQARASTAQRTDEALDELADGLSYLVDLHNGLQRTISDLRRERDAPAARVRVAPPADPRGRGLRHVGGERLGQLVLVHRSGAVDAGAARFLDQLVLARRGGQRGGLHGQPELGALGHERGGHVLEHPGPVGPELREHLVLFFLDVVVDGGLDRVEGGGEPRLVRGEGHHLRQGRAGDLVLVLALLDGFLAHDGLRLRVDDRLLELHVRLERRGELVHERRTVLALRVLDLGEEPLDGAVVGFEHPGDIHGPPLPAGLRSKRSAEVLPCGGRPRRDRRGTP